MHQPLDDIGVQRIPPQDLQAEEGLLGACLVAKEAVGVAVELLAATDFYRDANKEIFSIIQELFDRSEPVDMVTVVNGLKEAGKLDLVGGAARVATLSDVIPLGPHVASWARIIKKKSQLRRLIRLGSELIELGYVGSRSIEEIMAEAEAGLFALSSPDHEAVRSLKEIVPVVMETIEKRQQADSSVTGVHTGFHEMDRMTSGWQPGDLIILAGRPSMGKTALAFNLMLNAKVPGLAFSLEMSGDELGERLLSNASLVNSQAMRTGNVMDRDWPKLTVGQGKLQAKDIHVDESASLSVVDVRIRARRMKARHDIGVIVVDYLQLMRGRTSNSREQEIADISRGLKTLAKELKVPVIALSQLNRGVEQRADKRPKLSDLRESGAIEQDADVILFIYRDDYYNTRSDNPNKGLASIIIAKQRKGPTGDFDLHFQPEFSRFEDLSTWMDEPWG